MVVVVDEQVRKMVLCHDNSVVGGDGEDSGSNEDDGDGGGSKAKKKGEQDAGDTCLQRS